MVKTPSISSPNSAAKKAALLLREKQAKSAGPNASAATSHANEVQNTEGTQPNQATQKDRFELSSKPADLPVVGKGSGNAASLRIQSMLGDVSFELAKKSTVSKSADGKIAQGDLNVVAAKDLDVLKGVEIFRGNLSLEGLDVTSLAALSTLRSVGSLSLEGLTELSSLSDLANLQEVDLNLYVGFNDGLDRVDLPGLKSVGGALIVEGQLHARNVSLPALKSVGKYTHVTENLALRELDLGALAGSDIVVADNYALQREGLKGNVSVEWSNNYS